MAYIAYNFKINTVEELIHIKFDDKDSDNQMLKLVDSFRDWDCRTRNTTNMGLLYKKSQDNKLVELCDSDYAGDRTERKKKTSRNC